MTLARTFFLAVCIFAGVAGAAETSVLVFLRPGQPQSDDAITQLGVIISKHSPAQGPQVSVIVSGPAAANDAAQFAPPRDLNAKVIADTDYALAGKHSVHVWPATLVFNDGRELARIAGLPQSYSSDLAGYLEFAAGRIDKAALDERLGNKHVVAPTSQQAATRHVMIADALMERGQLEEAMKEVEEGLQRQPGEVSLLLARAKLLLQLKQPAAALSAAEQLKDLVPSWQINLIRAESLIALERWSEAKGAADEAVKLNPNPAHANYLRGLVCSHDADWKGAAEAFRLAYESKRNARH